MPLKVKINSFSYKKSGIPPDNTGNGGGFVFDCRFIENPGRKNEFKFKTGLDTEVVLFLDSQEEMNTFLKNVYAIIEPAIENYLKRNFTDLMISFGCTGGQHRSVYAAKKTSDHISKKYFQVIIELNQTEIEKGINIG